MQSTARNVHATPRLRQVGAVQLGARREREFVVVLGHSCACEVTLNSSGFRLGTAKHMSLTGKPLVDSREHALGRNHAGVCGQKDWCRSDSSG